MEYVLMVVPSDFPNGDAGAVRDFVFAKIYQELGYEIVLIGMGKNETVGNYYGVNYYSLYKKRKTAWEHLNYYFGYMIRCRRLMDKLMKEKGEPALIHINDISHGMIRWIISFGKKKRIPILHDSTEWYSPCEFNKGRLDKAYILKDRLNKSVIRNPVRVIAISEYLRNHFIMRGLRAIRIPVIMDIMSIQAKTVRVEEKKRYPDIVRLIYAGSPASKDYLSEIMDAASTLQSEIQGRIELNILGVNEKQLCDLAQINVIPSYVKVYGRVPRKTVLETMQSMDFALLLRPENERYAKAGFPTKSVEAMAHGVAMLCNITSDLGMYLEDGENAIVVKDCSSKAVAEAILRVTAMSREEIETIKSNARKLAEKEFDYRLYVNRMKELLAQNK